jgi:hypothetical protein
MTAKTTRPATRPATKTPPPKPRPTPTKAPAKPQRPTSPPVGPMPAPGLGTTPGMRTFDGAAAERLAQTMRPSGPETAAAATARHARRHALATGKPTH